VKLEEWLPNRCYDDEEWLHEVLELVITLVAAGTLVVSMDTRGILRMLVLIQNPLMSL
jgi:hypothetical protein